MKKRLYYIIFPTAAIIIIGAFFLGRINITKIEKISADENILPVIEPDYINIAIPENISPLNFKIDIEADEYVVKISGDDKTLIIKDREGNIKIPSRKWKKLLQTNAGKDLKFEIFLKGTDKGWKRYLPYKIHVAGEGIDDYLAYRFFLPNFNWWKKIGIYERKMSSFKTSTIVHTKYVGNSCYNCHTFLNKSTEKFFVALRGSKHGSASLLAEGKNISKVGAKFGYTSWHPSGKLVSYSINKVRQIFHSSADEVRDVFDMDSGILYYDLESRSVKTHPLLTRKDELETYPTWSPDGEYLYFCSAPIVWENRDEYPLDHYKDIKYSLMRIPYSLDTDEWGKLDTVLSSQQTGLSITLPKISPDGRHLLFCMSDYGCFPIYRPSSDLYILDLETFEYSRAEELCSDYSESWHSWSSNGRWVAFSSKRQGGRLTRIYLSYFDKDGKFHKPFVLPQNNPDFYQNCLQTFSYPEFITSSVKTDLKKFVNTIESEDKIDVDVPQAISGATVNYESSAPWKSGQIE